MTWSLPLRGATSPEQRHGFFAAMILTFVVALTACSTPGNRSEVEPPGSSKDASPAPAATAGTSGSTRPVKATQTGRATFMADRLNGKKTASGERYDGTRLVAAHPRFPLGTVVRVTNPQNGRSVEVEIVDRSARGARRPIIDLSRAAAERLDIVRRGTATVRVDVIEWGTQVPK